MKTSQLTGVNLDWAVALCDDIVDKWFDSGHLTVNGEIYSPSTDWSQGGPIIERECIDLHCVNDSFWRADCSTSGGLIMQNGPTPLIAAMRCYVASILGDEVNVPEEFK